MLAQQNTECNKVLQLFATPAGKTGVWWLNINHYFEMELKMQSYSAALCADFNDLKETNRLTLDSFTTTLLSYLRFRAQTTSNIVTTTLDTLAKFFNASVSILRKSVKKLADLGVITISITTTPKGYKRTSIKVLSNEKSFFDYEKISILRNHTNDDELSLLYSFIAFKLTAFDKLGEKSWVKEIDGKIWWKLDAKRIVEQFSISERTASRRVRKLCSLGLVNRQRIDGAWYCSIDQNSYKKIFTDHQEFLCKKRPSCDFVVCPSATSELSSINNTLSDERNIYINNNTRDSDINLNNLDEIGKDLSKRQIAYLLAAIKITAKKMKFDVLEIFGWIKFSILNPCQRKGTSNFKHAVNRFIKLLRERKLKMPFGYNKYTEEGRQFWQGVVERETQKANDFFTSEPQAQDDIVYEGSFSIDDETWQNMLEANQEQIDRPNENERDRLVLGEMSNKETDGGIMQESVEERDKRLLNEKAERFARALASKSKDESANARILEGLQFELERCVRQGADVDAIHDILANG